MNILKGSAVYQFKYADGAQQASVAIQNSLKHVQVSLADLAEYRSGPVEEFQDRGTGGYDASKVRSSGYQDRGGGGRGRGRGRDTYRDSYRDDRRDDRPPYDNSRRYDDRRYDTRRNDDTRRPYNRDDDSRGFNRDDRNDKPYNRRGQSYSHSFSSCPL